MKLKHTLKLVLAMSMPFSLVLAAERPNPPPPAPTGLTASLEGASGVVVSWNASAGATSYSVFASTTQNDTSPRQIASGIVDTSFTAPHLRTDTTYYFKVQALGPGGASDFAREVSITTKITKQPFMNGTYTIAPRGALERRLQVDARKVTIGDDTGSPSQQWLLTSVNLATYRISPASDPEDALVASGDGTTVSRYEEDPSHQWTLTPATEGYRLTPANDADAALSASAADAGSSVGQARADGSRAQVWNILPVSESAPDPGTAYVPEGYTLEFSDEFNGNALDLEKWEPLAPYSQHYLNDEIECYEAEAVIVHGGVCILRAEERPTSCGGTHTWRSGSITSRSTRSEGYFEARIKMPLGKGMWPAFWLTSSKRWPPEWDILEIPHTDGTLYQYMHPIRGAKQVWIDGLDGPDSTWKAGEGMPNPYSGFVVYGCLVTPQGVTLWVNGKKTGQWSISAGTTDPMWVNCELAVGGKWPGMPDDTTPEVSDMVIDYVRVYQRAP